MAEFLRMNRSVIDTRQVRLHFSNHAEEYDRYAVVQKKVIVNLLDLLRSCGPMSGPVLEVGCGTGTLSRQIYTLIPELPLTISDIAHGMTRHAARSVPGIAAVDADAQDLPFRESGFGLVLSSSVYQWMNDLPRAFAEGARVLAPGGRFAFALFGEGTLYELRESHRLAVAETGGGRSSHVQDFPASEEVRSALVAAGFEGVLVRSVYEVERHPGVEILLRNLKRIGAQNAAGRQPPGLGSRRVMQRMIQIYRQRYGGEGNIPATYEVIYGIGRKPA
jgi:malonyl-CoA O-methyltransferase